MVTKVRIEANEHFREICPKITGHVLSVGSDDDHDHQGHKYRSYFRNAASYTTSDMPNHPTPHPIDLIIDIRNVPEIKDESYDCIFCNGVLEHIDRFQDALNELTRILKTGGTLILGTPFKQSIHLAPYDYWRFTKYGLSYLLNHKYKIVNIKELDSINNEFPSAYIVEAIKK